MSGPVGQTNARLNPARWLLVPVTLLLFALVGLALSTEDRDEFEARRSAEAGLEAGTGGDTGDASSGDPAQGSRAGSAPSSTMVAGEGASGTFPDDPIDGITSSEDDQQPQGSGRGPGPGDEAGGSEGGRGTANVEITASAGRLDVLLGGADPLARPVGPDGVAGQPAALAQGPSGLSLLDGGNPAAGSGGPSDTGTVAGFRLGADGALEPVGLDEMAPGDLVVAPADAGIDVLRSDGSRVELRPDATGGSPLVDAVEVGADGTSRGLGPDHNGVIAIGDGISIQVPVGVEPPGPATPSGSEPLTTGRWPWLLAGLAVALAVAATVVVMRRRRERRAEPFGPGWVGSTSVPQDRFDELAARIDADPDPARAIRLAFATAERGFGALPPRLSSETPFEWYRRVAASQPGLADHMAGLCAAFANARFAAGPPSSEDRAAAVTELRQLHQIAHDRALLHTRNQARDQTPDQTRESATAGVGP